MNILIPMAGAGSRFATAGYSQHKPVIPVSSRLRHETVPMVVAAVEDLPVNSTGKEARLIFIVRDFHLEDGVDVILKKRFPDAHFISIDRLTEGQASTCLLARELIDNNEPLLIAACDNGMDVSKEEFEKEAQTADALIFTFRNNEAVLLNPKSYGWIRVEGDKVSGVSIKQPISENPINDHAVVGTFWFRRGHDFVRAADQMIAANDRINNEFYVDQVFKYLVNSGSDIRVTEISRYICWGTPEDYEAYESTLSYWTEFTLREPWTR
ncbi:nucleotidyltransferase [Agrobacterium tumefaciens]|uniref:nucleotidyltransferase n=1 Tax=Agrobacterium tumefaciens TaxID=358 RepID=UPI00157257ED|nr:nucleotidyltransferase [Agrobacterium tumefaciens]WCJ64395.1 nucleotidyltransferase [Agrobacterium tumefaciens]